MKVVFNDAYVIYFLISIIKSCYRYSFELPHSLLSGAMFGILLYVGILSYYGILCILYALTSCRTQAREACE